MSKSQSIGNSPRTTRTADVYDVPAGATGFAAFSKDLEAFFESQRTASTRSGGNAVIIGSGAAEKGQIIFGSVQFREWKSLPTIEARRAWVKTLMGSHAFNYGKFIRLLKQASIAAKASNASDQGFYLGERDALRLGFYRREKSRPNKGPVPLTASDLQLSGNDSAATTRASDAPKPDVFKLIDATVALKPGATALNAMLDPEQLQCIASSIDNASHSAETRRANLQRALGDIDEQRRLIVLGSTDFRLSYGLDLLLSVTKTLSERLDRIEHGTNRERQNDKPGMQFFEEGQIVASNLGYELRHAVDVGIVSIKGAAEGFTASLESSFRLSGPPMPPPLPLATH